jgi:hypothetical protein
MLRDEYLTADEVVALKKKTRGWLQHYTKTGRGPAHEMWGKHKVYRRDVIEAWNPEKRNRGPKKKGPPHA